MTTPEELKTSFHKASETMLFMNSDYPVKAVPYSRVLEILNKFEKAHAPTDDEREALAQAIRDSLGVTPETIAAGHQRPGNTDDLARDLIARGFGFRRTEVPEPSADEDRIIDEAAMRSHIEARLLTEVRASLASDVLSAATEEANARYRYGEDDHEHEVISRQVFVAGALWQAGTPVEKGEKR